MDTIRDIQNFSNKEIYARYCFKGKELIAIISADINPCIKVMGYYIDSHRQNIEDNTVEFESLKELCDYYNIEYDLQYWRGNFSIDNPEYEFNLGVHIKLIDNTNTEECETFDDIEVITNDLGAGKHKTVVSPLNISDDTLRKQAEYTADAISRKNEENNKKMNSIKTESDVSETNVESCEYNIEDFNKEVQGVDAEYLATMCRIKKAVLLVSHPGTGKTTTAIELAKYITGETNSNRVMLLSFNHDTSYSDTIGGIGKKSADTDWDYIIGSIASLCDRANNDLKNTYICILDEINRANTAAVLGELITAMSKRGVYVTTNHNKRIVVPRNVWFIGTMNSTDNSISELDTALVDRFQIYEMPEIIVDCDKIRQKKESELGISLPENLVIGMEYVNDAIVAINKQLITNTYKGKDNQIGNRALYSDHESLMDLVFTIRHDIKPKVEAKYEGLEQSAIDEIKKIFDELDNNIKSLIE